MPTIGQRISELRKNSSFSQEYVAEKLNVSRQAVSKWEQDLSAPDTYNLIALAELFDVSVEYLATGKLRDTTPPPSPSPSAPTQRSGITVRQILGLIFVAVGLLAGILGLVLNDMELLLIFAAYLIILGIVCIAVKKYFGIYLLWTLFALTAPLVLMFMPVSMGFSIGGIFLILFIGLFILTIVFTAIKIIKNKQK